MFQRALRQFWRNGMLERNLITSEKPCFPSVTSRHFGGRTTSRIGRTKGLNSSETSRHLKFRENKKCQIFRSPHQYNMPLKFKITGYDIVLVESFARVVHHLFQKLEYKVDELYAEPTYECHIKDTGNSLQSKPDEMETIFSLSHHTRVFKVDRLPASAKPILIQMMMYFVPQSVSFEVSPLEADDTQKRMQRRVAFEEAKAELQFLRDA